MYKFNNGNINELWKQHPSYKDNVAFQRLEFLGDKALAFYISKLLLKKYPLISEGQLSIALSNMVNRSTLAKIGSFLVPHIVYTGNINDRIISDCLEAWIGAICEDNGNIEYIIESLWNDYFKSAFIKNPKNILQEIAQKNKQQLIYIFKKEGVNFICTVILDNIQVQSFATSKKNASENAAKLMLNKLKTK